MNLSFILLIFILPHNSVNPKTDHHNIQYQ